MNSCLRYSVLYMFIGWVSAVYRYSRMKRIVVIISQWYQYSILHRMFMNFTAKKPAAPHSITYRLLRTIGIRTDAVVDRIHIRLASCIRSSKCFLLYEAFRHECSNRSGPLLLTAILGFIAGYCMIITVRGMWSIKRLGYIVILAAAYLIYVSIGKNLRTWIENSLIYRLYKQ